ncbi:MAG TPA: hypothetical protein VFH25_08035 [Nitrososphaeraceae archaeon]|nr:hypothetical protein [Nitrososphaeraceae archaeon]
MNGHCLLSPHTFAFPSNTIDANNTCNLIGIVLVDDDDQPSSLFTVGVMAKYI